MTVLPQQRNERENVIPLINVVFLLLIFFMIAGQMVQPEALDITPPDSANTYEPQSIEQKILVDAKGRIMLDESQINLSSLSTQIDAETPITLKVDKQCSRDCFLPVLKVFQEAGIEKIQLITLQQVPAST